MARYRKKTDEVEAWQVGSDEPMPKWARACCKNANNYEMFGYMYINAHFGEARVEKGDYVIRFVNGELHICKQDTFEQTYEAVE